MSGDRRRWEGAKVSGGFMKMKKKRATGKTDVGGHKETADTTW